MPWAAGRLLNQPFRRAGLQVDLSECADALVSADGVPAVSAAVERDRGELIIVARKIDLRAAPNGESGIADSGPGRPAVYAVFPSFETLT